MHLSTEEPAASLMLEPFGEVGGDVPEYFSSRTHFAKIEGKRVVVFCGGCLFAVEFFFVYFLLLFFKRLLKTA